LAEEVVMRMFTLVNSQIAADLASATTRNFDLAQGEHMGRAGFLENHPDRRGQLKRAPAHRQPA
jgi:hypothetical protein